MKRDSRDRPLRYIYPSGLSTHLAYDVGPGSSNTGRTLSVARGLDMFGNGGSQLNQALGTTSYAYDVRGNITSIAEARRTRSFTYDAIERLKKVEEPRPDPNPPAETESYTLDGEGNRVASHASAFHITTPGNRLQEDEQHAYFLAPPIHVLAERFGRSGRRVRRRRQPRSDRCASFTRNVNRQRQATHQDGQGDRAGVALHLRRVGPARLGLALRQRG